MSDEIHGVKGGQGRTAKELTELSWLFWLIVLVLIAVSVAWLCSGCCRPNPEQFDNLRSL